MFFNVVARTLCGAAFGFVFSKGLMWIGKAGSPKKKLRHSNFYNPSFCYCWRIVGF